MTDQRSLSLPDILAAIEADCDAAVGRAFVAVAADYFEQTRSREGRVSSAHTAAGLAARFDEPLPLAGQSVDAIIARLEKGGQRFSLAIMTDGDPDMGYGIQTIQSTTYALLHRR